MKLGYHELKEVKRILENRYDAVMDKRREFKADYEKRASEEVANIVLEMLR